MYSEHRVPTPFQDEDRWFKLTKRQIVIVLIAAAICIPLCTILNKFGLLQLGVMISTVIGAIAVIVCFVELPEDKYIYGTGVKLEILALRLIMKKFKKDVYTKNYDNYNSEENE